MRTRKMYKIRTRKIKKNKTKGGMFKRPILKQLQPHLEDPLKSAQGVRLQPQLYPQLGHPLKSTQGQPQLYPHLGHPLKSTQGVQLKPQLYPHLGHTLEPALGEQPSTELELLINLTDGNKDFMRLCNKHIMVTILDSVVETTWINNGDCNIFLIGEEHDGYDQCTSIVDMFKNLITDKMYPDVINPLNPEIDLMIEYPQKESVLADSDDNLQLQNGYRRDIEQIKNLSKSLNTCIRHRNCPVRVHWADPTEVYYNDNTKQLPRWLQRLSEYNDSIEWTQNPTITEHLRSEDDIYKLLTYNRRVVREVIRANKINDNFSLTNIKNLFMELLTMLKINEPQPRWEYYVFSMLRNVVDIYTIARIIKSKMTNVIFYGGQYHTSSIIFLLRSFGFNIVRHLDGKCLDKVPVKHDLLKAKIRAERNAAIRSAAKRNADIRAASSPR